MSHCPNCNHCDDCSQALDGNAPNGVSTTRPIGSRVTSSGTVLSAVTDRRRAGISPDRLDPYLDILGELATALKDGPDALDLSPLMHLAINAVEYELAERLLDTNNLVSN